MVNVVTRSPEAPFSGPLVRSQVPLHVPSKSVRSAARAPDTRTHESRIVARIRAWPRVKGALAWHVMVSPSLIRPRHPSLGQHFPHGFRLCRDGVTGPGALHLTAAKHRCYDSAALTS